MSDRIYEELIWSLKAHLLRDMPPIDPNGWAGAVHSELLKFDAATVLEAPQAPAPPFLGAAVVMMVKDEGDIIGENLTWLYRSGIRRLIVLNNGSTDDTGEILKRFERHYRDAELLVLNDPIVRYMQSEKTTGLYRLAISIWPDLRWVLPIDADEFLIAERGIAILDEIDPRIDAVSIPKVIHFRNQAADDGIHPVMQTMNLRSPPFLVPPKIVVRNNLFMTIGQGNHKVRLVDDRPPVYIGGFQFGLYYREFPTRSFPQFLRKIRNGGAAIQAAESFLGRKVGGEHWLHLHDHLLSGGERKFFERYQADWIRNEGVDWIVDPFVVEVSF
ncbi:glycosyltransferase family 2 protein [Gluconacetobacter sacchari]|uniref:glycosyltransferase family 2 protein n=1 Tax=Gluconacetobacter sacchari TaxID=92759 RepID=UPI0039B3ECF1